MAIFGAKSAQSAVKSVAVPGPPVFEDTECRIDVPFASTRPHVRNFGFSIGAEFTPSNSIEVAFGRDTDLDGLLDFPEREFRFAWDAGEWIMGGADFADVSVDIPASVDDEKVVSWRIRLPKSGEPESLAIKENGIAIFASLEGEVPEYAYSPLWDTVRIISRGYNPSEGQITLECSPDGFCIFIR